MEITLKHYAGDANGMDPEVYDDRPDHTASANVAHGDWVGNSISAAWEYLRYNGGGSVTACEPSGARIATVGLTIHDE